MQRGGEQGKCRPVGRVLRKIRRPIDDFAENYREGGFHCLKDTVLQFIRHYLTRHITIKIIKACNILDGLAWRTIRLPIGRTVFAISVVIALHIGNVQFSLI